MPSSCSLLGAAAHAASVAFDTASLAQPPTPSRLSSASPTRMISARSGQGPGASGAGPRRRNEVMCAATPDGAWGRSRHPGRDTVGSARRPPRATLG